MSGTNNNPLLTGAEDPLAQDQAKVGLASIGANGQVVPDYQTPIFSGSDFWYPTFGAAAQPTYAPPTSSTPAGSTPSANMPSTDPSATGSSTGGGAEQAGLGGMGTQGGGYGEIDNRNADGSPDWGGNARDFLNALGTGVGGILGGPGFVGGLATPGGSMLSTLADVFGLGGGVSTPLGTGLAGPSTAYGVDPASIADTQANQNAAVNTIGMDEGGKLNAVGNVGNSGGQDPAAAALAGVGGGFGAPSAGPGVGGIAGVSGAPGVDPASIADQQAQTAGQQAQTAGQSAAPGSIGVDDGDKLGGAGNPGQSQGQQTAGGMAPDQNSDVVSAAGDKTEQSAPGSNTPGNTPGSTGPTANPTEDTDLGAAVESAQGQQASNNQARDQEVNAANQSASDVSGERANSEPAQEANADANAEVEIGGGGTSQNYAKGGPVNHLLPGIPTRDPAAAALQGVGSRPPPAARPTAGSAPAALPPHRGFAAGGPVAGADLQGPNPAGPDQGYAALQPGEFVVNRDQAQQPGNMATLEAMNDGATMPPPGANDMDADDGAGGASSDDLDPAMAVQNLNALDPQSRVLLAQSLAQPGIANALAQVLGPAFVPVVQQMATGPTAQPQPGMGGAPGSPPASDDDGDGGGAGMPMNPPGSPSPLAGPPPTPGSVAPPGYPPPDSGALDRQRAAAALHGIAA